MGTEISRRGAYCALGVGGVVALAVLARQLASWNVPPLALRLAMLAFILLCPVLLGFAIGVWGGSQGGVWGSRGVGLLYAGVVLWAWAGDGVFPVGFRLPGFPTPLFVTLTNVGIFVITMYFMQTLGRSGGRLSARVTALVPLRTSPQGDNMSDVTGSGERV